MLPFITIIIPEHNRPKHLRRTVEYFLKYNVSIIICDSSTEAWPYYKDYETKVLYKYLPNTTLAEKTIAILDFINTPYVTMCANDDFISFPAIERIIQFLDTHSDYYSGQGLYIDFSISCSSSNIPISMRYINMENNSLDEELPENRALHLAREYYQFYYSIFRTSVFKEVYKSSHLNSCNNIRNLCLLELFVSFFSALQGKHIVLPVFYSARENIMGSAGAKTETLDVIHSHKKYKAEFKFFKKTLINQLEFSSNRAEQTINDVIEILLKKNFKYKRHSFIRFIVKIDVFNIRYLLFKERYQTHTHIVDDSLSGIEEWAIMEQYIRSFPTK